MPVPSWSADIEGGFNISASPVRTYVALTNHFVRHLSGSDVHSIQHGLPNSWPREGMAVPAIILALHAVTHELEITTPTRETVKTCCRKILARIHPDKFENSDARTYYASCACTSMILRCLSIALGEEAMQVHPMPRMLITPFAADVARTNPPSRFEYYAAKIAGQRVDSYRAHWSRIARVGADPQLVGAESAFWTNNDATGEFAHEIFFCCIGRGEGISDYSFRFEGRVGVLENQPNNDNPQAAPHYAQGNQREEHHARPPNPPRGGRGGGN